MWLPRIYKLARESSEELSIYLSATMKPIINDEWELQEWLIELGFQPILLNDKNPEIDAKLKAALSSTSGTNFVTAEPVFAIH